MKVYEAFCGIGGFSLGFQRAGFEIVGGCEIDEPKRRAWAEKFQTECDADIATVGNIRNADMLCGGFPCQPFSLAGQGAKESDSRNLWPELLRLLEIGKPRWFVGENVPGIGKYLDTVCENLEALSYEVLPLVLPAAAFAAPHLRYRVFIVAHSRCIERDRSWNYAGNAEEEEFSRKRHSKIEVGNESEVARRCIEHWWLSEPPICGMADGVSEELVGIGNSVCPQIAQWLAERIKEIEFAKKKARASKVILGI